MPRSRPAVDATASRRSPLRSVAPTLAAVGLLLGFLLGVGLGLGGAASAESPTRVADGLVDDGVFVGFGRNDVDEATLVAAVADAQDRGLDLVVVVPRDPQPSAKAFARRIQEKTEAEVALVFPLDGPVEAYVLEDLSSARPRALDAARALDEPAAAIDAFAVELTTIDDSGRPPIVGQIFRALVVFSLLIGVVVAIELVVSRLRRPAAASS
ncbi:MAG: hypothetical protein AAGA93_02985 [Actinomycetota bacterium]